MPSARSAFASGWRLLLVADEPWIAITISLEPGADGLLCHWRNAISLPEREGIFSSSGRSRKSTLSKGLPIETSGRGGAPVPNTIMAPSTATTTARSPQIMTTSIGDLIFVILYGIQIFRG